MTHTGELQCGDCEYIHDNPDVNQYGTLMHDWHCSLKNERVYPVAFVCKRFSAKKEMPDAGE